MPPAELVLVSAVYADDIPAITLTFDRPIDVTALDGSAIVVNDPVYATYRYDATGFVTVLGLTSVRINLTDIDTASGSEITLTASGATGIVAVDDGAAWAGVTDVELPFG